MILELEQTFSRRKALYRVLSEGDCVGTAEINFNDNPSLHGVCDFNGFEDSYRVQYVSALKLKSFLSGSGEKVDHPYEIMHSGERVGKIYDTLSDGPIFNRYSCTHFELDGIVRSMFTVGLGKEGVVYPIYAGQRQTALVEKDGIVRDNMDIYNITLSNDSEAVPAILLALFADLRFFSHRENIYYISVKKKYYKTTNKALQAKYDPSFAKRYS